MQSQLQDVNFEKNRLHKTLTNQDGFGRLEDIANKISAMIYKRSSEGYNFNEDETTIFRTLFGSQVVEAIDRAKEENFFNDQQASACAPFSPKSNDGLRGTFKMGDAKHNEAVFDSMIPAK